MDFISHSPTETAQIAKTIAGRVRSGDIFCFYGELGAGKTTLLKNIIKTLGVKKEAKSPTFSLMNVYPVNKGTIKNLVHIDTYRLKDAQELVDIGAMDYLGAQNTVCFVEWPGKITELLAGKKTVDVRIEHIGENERKIIF